jgi:hypothetical protein
MSLRPAFVISRPLVPIFNGGNAVAFAFRRRFANGSVALWLRSEKSSLRHASHPPLANRRQKQGYRIQTAKQPGLSPVTSKAANRAE